MDYKYIEQLVERYWNCETTTEEERILRTFFSQKDVPVQLLQYRDLFAYQQQHTEAVQLGEDFDARILQQIDEPLAVKAHTITLKQRLAPLFRAAAVVAIIVTLVNAADRSMNRQPVGTMPEEPTITVADVEQMLQERKANRQEADSTELQAVTSSAADSIGHKASPTPATR